MKSIYFSFRNVLLLTAFTLVYQFSNGQTIGINYTPSQPAGALAWNTGSGGSVALPTLTGADDVVATFTAPATWGGMYYGGVWYPQATTTFYVSSNGWMSLSKPGDPVPRVRFRSIIYQQIRIESSPLYGMI